jgi:hypothetical protein
MIVMQERMACRSGISSGSSKAAERLRWINGGPFAAFKGTKGVEPNVLERSIGRKACDLFKIALRCVRILIAPLDPPPAGWKYTS